LQSPNDVALDVGDAARAKAGALGQFFLREVRRQAVLLEEISKRRRAGHVHGAHPFHAAKRGFRSALPRLAPIVTRIIAAMQVSRARHQGL